MSSKELDRRYRLAKQSAGQHYALADRARKKSRIAEGLLLAASVVFCATTFAGNDLYAFIGVSKVSADVILGIAAVVAFFCSILLLFVDWREESARHTDAGDKYSSLSLKFRRLRHPDGSWSESHELELSKEYEMVGSSTIKIPDKKFNPSKAQYLTKKEVSKLASDHPGTPLFVLRIIVRFNGIRSVLKGKGQGRES